MNTFIFRTDGNSRIGLGHVMRCLSIADECRNKKYDVIFLISDNYAQDLINERGYRCIVLKSNYTDMEAEVEKYDDYLEIRDCEDDVFFVVDSYYVTEKYLNLVRGYEEFTIVYIDDLMGTPYSVDILINYNLYADENDYLELYAGNPPRLVLGVNFVPLREMFKNIKPRMQKQIAKDILITTGGADPKHLAVEFIKQINMRDDGFVYHLLIGRANTDRDYVKKLAEVNSSIIVEEDVSDMCGLIQGCDIAVSASGSTLYEICTCGVPVVTYVMADNQMKSAKGFATLNIAINCGDVRGNIPDSVKRILDSVARLNEDYNRRCDMGRIMQKTCDGEGTRRIVEELIKYNKKR